MSVRSRRIGILADGDDYPGLNPLIRAIVLRGIRESRIDFVGFVDGWQGVIGANIIDLDWGTVRGISATGGTILGAAPRTEPVVTVDVATVRAGVHVLDLDGLLLVGGHEMISAANRLKDGGIPVVTVPVSVENCLSVGDMALGFDTVVGIAVEAIERLRVIGETQQQATIAEVIGREAGWIALNAGLAAAADVVLVPEWPQSTEEVLASLDSCARRGRSPLIVVAEGFALTPERPRDRGASARLRHLIESDTGRKPLTSVLTAVQRGANPSALDRVLATRLGYTAAGAAVDGRWGSMVMVGGRETAVLPLRDHPGKRTVSHDQYRHYEELLG